MFFDGFFKGNSLFERFRQEQCGLRLKPHCFLLKFKMPQSRFTILGGSISSIRTTAVLTAILTRDDHTLTERLFGFSTFDFADDSKGKFERRAWAL